MLLQKLLRNLLVILPFSFELFFKDAVNLVEAYQSELNVLILEVVVKVYLTDQGDIDRRG